MYLLIAYKPHSTDYCRGCLMATYRDDHEVYNFLSREKLVTIWSEYLQKNLNLECNEHGYDFWIFKDGVMVFSETYPKWDGYERYGYNTDEYYEHFVELEAQEAADTAEINALFNEALVLAQSQQKLKVQAAQQKAQAEKQLAEEKAREHRLREYNRLQQEFGA